VDRHRLPGQVVVRQVAEHPAYRRLPVGAQREHLVEGLPHVLVVLPLQVAKRVEGEVERRPRVGVTEVDPVHPGVGGVAEVAEGLDEGPLVVDPLVQQRRVEAAGALDGQSPAVFQDVPGLAEVVGRPRLHLGVVGIPTHHLGLDQRPDVDAVDDDVLQLAVDLDVEQLGASDPESVQIGLPDPHVVQVDQPERRPGQVDAIEAGVPQVGALVRDAREVLPLVAHAARVGEIPDDPRPVGGSARWATAPRSPALPSGDG
jgi:hypothetical protein